MLYDLLIFYYYFVLHTEFISMVLGMNAQAQSASQQENKPPLGLPFLS